jgi:hypothetical protein
MRTLHFGLRPPTSGNPGHADSFRGVPTSVQASANRESQVLLEPPGRSSSQTEKSVTGN